MRSGFPAGAAECVEGILDLNLITGAAAEVIRDHLHLCRAVVCGDQYAAILKRQGSVITTSGAYPPETTIPAQITSAAKTPAYAASRIIRVPSPGRRFYDAIHDSDTAMAAFCRMGIHFRQILAAPIRYMQLLANLLSRRSARASLTSSET